MKSHFQNFSIQCSTIRSLLIDMQIRGIFFNFSFMLGSHCTLPRMYSKNLQKSIETIIIKGRTNSSSWAALDEGLVLRSVALIEAQAFHAHMTSCFQSVACRGVQSWKSLKLHGHFDLGKDMPPPAAIAGLNLWPLHEQHLYFCTSLDLCNCSWWSHNRAFCPRWGSTLLEKSFSSSVHWVICGIVLDECMLGPSALAGLRPWMSHMGLLSGAVYCRTCGNVPGEGILKRSALAAARSLSLSGVTLQLLHIVGFAQLSFMSACSGLGPLPWLRPWSTHGRFL